MLDRVRERLARDEVGGRLDARGDALRRRLDVDRHGRRAREIAQRGGEPVVEARGAHAGCDLAQVADRRSDLVHDLVERGREDLRLARQRALQAPDLDAERDEPLLRAVVEVALEPPALLVARLDDPRPRRLDLGELEAHLDAQPCDLDRERGRGEDVVAAGRAARAAPGSCSSTAVRAPSRSISECARPSSRQLGHELAGRVGVRLGLRQPEEHLASGSPKRLRQHRADLLRRAPALAHLLLEGPHAADALVSRPAEAPVDEILDARPQRPERERDGERRRPRPPRPSRRRRRRPARA